MAWRPEARDELHSPLLSTVFATRHSPESRVVGLKHFPLCFLGGRMTAIFAFLICEKIFFLRCFAVCIGLCDFYRWKSPPFCCCCHFYHRL